MNSTAAAPSSHAAPPQPSPVFPRVVPARQPQPFPYLPSGTLDCLGKVSGAVGNPRSLVVTDEPAEEPEHAGRRDRFGQSDAQVEAALAVAVRQQRPEAHAFQADVPAEGGLPVDGGVGAGLAMPIDLDGP